MKINFAMSYLIEVVQSYFQIRLRKTRSIPGLALELVIIHRRVTPALCIIQSH